MLRALSVALQGFTPFPLSAIAIAVQGLIAEIQAEYQAAKAVEIGGGGTPFHEDTSSDLQLMQDEDEIIILAVAQMIVQGVFT